eukprot:118655-Alexandrium_andersonii.AAC.1
MLDAQRTHGADVATGIEVGLVLRELVGEFRGMREEARKNRESTLALARELQNQRESVQTHKKSTDALMKRLRQRINELRSLLPGAGGQPPYVVPEGPGESRAVETVLEHRERE